MESKDFIGKFSFQDLLAYFFPGLVMTVGLLFLLNQVNIIDYSEINIDVFSGLVFFLFSFVIGVVTSGLSNPLINWIYYIKKIEKPDKSIQLTYLKEDLKKAFKKEFDLEVNDENWNEEYFYLCRNTVYEYMPGSSSSAFRQGGLRLLRSYMMFPTLFWSLNGVIYGIMNFQNSCLLSISLILLSLIIGIYMQFNLWKRLYLNRIREIKYTLISFIGMSMTRELKGSE